MLLIYLLYIALVFYQQVTNLKAARNSKIRTIGIFAAYAISPVIVYSIAFMALVGIEQLFDVALIGEGYARSLPFVVVGGTAATIVATFIFSIVAFIMKTNNTHAT